MKGKVGLERRLADIVRYCREQEEILRTEDRASVPVRDRMAHFAHIADRSGETRVEVGMEARVRIERWSFDHLVRRGWTHLISIRAFAERVEEAIAFRFFRTRRVVDASAVARMIAALDRAVATDVLPHRYLWLCHICFGAEPGEFRIGPVRFRPTSLGGDDFDVALASWPSATGDAVRARIEEHYRSFGWIADVTIDTADKGAARRLSQLAVQTALTVIRLMQSEGGRETRIRMAAQPGNLLDYAELYFVEAKPHLSWHQDSGQVPFAETWWQTLNQGDNAIRLRALDRVVLAVTQPQEQTFLKLKYLNALRWFNDAAIDVHAGSRVVKFVTVLETLAGCNERDGLAEVVGDRVAYLLARWPEEGAAEEIRSRVKRVYALRSRLVHGVMDPIGLELGPVAVEAAHFAHMTLVAFLDLMIHIGVDRDDYDHARLARDFEIVRANVRREAGQV